jgi:ubiquitin-protein ligase
MVSTITSIIDIIRPPGYISLTDEELTIEHKQVKIVHQIKAGKITIIPEDCVSFHVVRVVINKLRLESGWVKSEITIKMAQAEEYLLLVKKVLESNFYDYCTICGKSHDKLGLSYVTHCSKPECEIEYYHYPTNNKVTDTYKSDSNTTMLLLRTLLSAMTHPKIDSMLKTIPKIRGIRSFGDLKKKIPPAFLENKLGELESLISSSYDDFFLWNKLENDTIFALILNAISNNYYSMYSYRDLVNTELKKTNVSTEDDVEYFNITYSTEVETEIKSKLDSGQKYYYLYHGSPFYCWYSIIKNGLKNMSNTEHMTTGAAYGPGIYASNTLSVSHGYARQCPPYNYSMIGVFQVLEDPVTYCKTSNIYVIPNEKILVLRTLIKINKMSHSGTLYRQLDYYFINQRTADKRTSDKNLVSLTNKRLSGELKFIQKNPEKFNVIYFTDTEGIPWQIDLIVGEQIYNVEIYFHNYPLSPPLIKMKNFTKGPKGIIGLDFKINLPELMPGAWTISNKIVEVLMSVWTFIESTYK